MSTAITRKEIIEDEALKWGEEYAKTVDKALSKNKEFVASIIALSEENSKLRKSETQNEFLKQKNDVNISTQKSIALIKEQMALEVAAEKIKKEKLSTQKSEAALDVQKAKAMQQINKLTAEDERLSQQKLKTEKEKAKTEKELIDLEIKRNQLKNSSIALNKSEIDFLIKEENLKKIKLQQLEAEERKIKESQVAVKQNIVAWKEQIALENALISTKKKNELATEGTNRALVKERTLLTETNRQVKDQVRNQLGLVTAYEKLNKSRNEAQKRLGDLLSAEKRNNAEIAKAVVEFDKLDIRVKSVDAAIKNYSKNIGNYQSAFSGLNSTARELISTFGLVTGIALFGQIIKDVFSVVKEFDRQLIAVGKTANISGAELKEFGRAVIELGGELDGVSIEGLLKSSEVAGQLGVSGTENILKFSTAIEKLKLTSDIITDDQVGQFAKFIEVSSDSFENADKLASVITRLGNEMATTEAEVLSNATEIQKGISVYNASAQSILGLGAATSSLGNEAEVSASSIQKGFGVINNAIATGKNLEQVLKLTNLTQKELAKQFNQDAAGTFVKFVGGLKKAKDEGQNLQVVLKEVELDEVRTFKTIGSLAANYEVLEKAMASAKQEYIENAALNKEVSAASESVSSILTDIKDKWQQFILDTNNANSGTEKLAYGLKFLRDNLQSIISNIIRYGTVLLVFLGVQRAVNFATSAWTAIQVASTAAQIRFALATGVGTKSILAQAAATRAAAASQEGLNVAMKANPWGLILAAVSALVVAYMVFNDELSENEKLVKRIADENKALQESEAFYNEQSDKFRQQRFTAIEKEIELRKAQGQNSESLDKEEIKRKREVVEADIKVFKDLKALEFERTRNQIAESEKRLAQIEKEFNSIQNQLSKFGDGPSVGKAMLESELETASEAKAAASANLRSLKNRFDQLSRLSQDELKKKNDILNGLEVDANIKLAQLQSEENKKARALRLKRLKERYDDEKKAQDDLFKLSQFRLQVAIDLDKEIVENDKAGLDQRIDALFESQQLYESKITEGAVRELQLLGEYNEDKGVFIRELSDLQISEIIRTGKTSEKLTSEQQLIFEKFQNEKTKAAKKGEVDRQKIVDDQVGIIQTNVDKENQIIDTGYNQRIINENKLYKASLEAAKDNFELIEQATIEHENRLNQIALDAAKEKVKNNIESLEKILEDNKKEAAERQLSADKVSEIENKLSNYKKELSEIEIDNDKLKNAKLIENAKLREETITDILTQNAERIKELSQSVADTLIGLTNSIFEARAQRIDEDINYWNDYYDQQIDMAGNDARQKELLEREKERKTKELEKERKKEMNKAAIFNRVISLAQIGFDLAKSLSAINLAARTLDTISFGTAGLPYQGLQTGLAIGLAAAQSATILAAPLPKYKMGREGGPAEMAITGDGFVKEVITDKFGNNPTITPAVPTFTYLNEGDIVHKSIGDYQKYLKASMYETTSTNYKKAVDFQNSNDTSDKSGYDKMILDELRKNTKAIEKNKGAIVLNNNIDLGHEYWKASNTNWKR